MASKHAKHSHVAEITLVQLPHAVASRYDRDRCFSISIGNSQKNSVSVKQFDSTRLDKQEQHLKRTDLTIKYPGIIVFYLMHHMTWMDHWITRLIMAWITGSRQPYTLTYLRSQQLFQVYLVSDRVYLSWLAPFVCSRWAQLFLPTFLHPTQDKNHS